MWLSTTVIIIKAEACVMLKVPMKRKLLFHIFVDKRLKIRLLLLKLNIAPFHNPKISVKHDKSYATN